MKRLSIIHIFAILLCPLLSYGLPFDSHLHALFPPLAQSTGDNTDYNFGKDLAEYFDNFNGNSILISPSYLIDKDSDFWGRSEHRGLYNQRISDTVKLYAGKLTGACGFNYTWDDSHIVLSECLNMFGMKGAKLYLDTGDPIHHIFQEEIHKNVTRAIETNKDKLKFLLTHITNEGFWAIVEKKPIEPAIVRDLEGLQVFMNIVDSYPQIQFIMAHALISLHTLESLKARYPKSLPDNLWLDMSAIFDDDTYRSEEEKSKMAMLMKAVGIEKILYGSDILLGAPTIEKTVAEYLNFSKQSFFDRPEFSDTEKNQVYSENGQRFLVRIQK